MKAPTKKEVCDTEEQNKIASAKRKEYRELAIRNMIKEADEKNAGIIIKQLSEMFQDQEISSQKGCSIRGIPVEMNSGGTLAKINEYLGGEWLASFEIDTGNAHDFETTNTLRILPLVK